MLDSSQEKIEADRVSSLGRCICAFQAHCMLAFRFSSKERKIKNHRHHRVSLSRISILWKSKPKITHQIIIGCEWAWQRRGTQHTALLNYRYTRKLYQNSCLLLLLSLLVLLLLILLCCYCCCCCVWWWNCTSTNIKTKLKRKTPSREK